MKKTAFMIVYNDADYIEYAIKSVIDWVDELVIVEGAFQITMKCGMPPRSNDGTIEIISKYVDNKKVFLKQVNLQEHKDHYQVGLDFAKQNGSDFAILIDSDEVWTKQAQILADKAMMNAEKTGMYELRVNEYCFINDFQTWYQGQYPRIFKVTPEARFIADNEVLWQDHNKSADRGRVEEHIHLLSPTIRIYHYGYVRRKKRWQLKQDYMKIKDGNPVLDQYKLKENTYIIPSDIQIYKFTGKHPDIMLSHPFHNLSSEEIIHG